MNIKATVGIYFLVVTAVAFLIVVCGYGCTVPERKLHYGPRESREIVYER